MEPIILTSQNFQQEVLDHKGLVLVDFWATWCGPCQMQAPILHEFAAEHPDLKIGKLDVDENGDIAMNYRVMSIPTLVLFQDGQVLKTAVGLQSKEALIDLCNI